MFDVIVTTREGSTVVLPAGEGVSIMEAIRDGGIDELLALCGGGCACATCHIYVDGDSAGRLAPMSEDENELLESSGYRTDRSRLACQIRMNAGLAGIDVTIAPED